MIGTAILVCTSIHQRRSVLRDVREAFGVCQVASYGLGRAGSPSHEKRNAKTGAAGWYSLMMHRLRNPLRQAFLQQVDKRLKFLVARPDVRRQQPQRHFRVVHFLEQLVV